MGLTTGTTGYQDYDNISDDPLTELMLALLSGSMAAVVLTCYIRDLIDSGICKKGFYHAAEWQYESTGNTLEEPLNEGINANQQQTSEMELGMDMVKSSSGNEQAVL